MLDLLKSRLPHDVETEMRLAAGEQNKITKIRLEKLIP
jgi:2-oxo-4-hydroxy-4-carboxy-5-ureidoimidazoline decarboxylase